MGHLWLRQQYVMEILSFIYVSLITNLSHRDGHSVPPHRAGALPRHSTENGKLLPG